jgi:YfiH family protein
VDLPWSQPDEVHGVDVGVVRHPGDADRLRADALVTDCERAVIGIWVGDCAPVALVSETGRIGGVHAGWRGLRDGVVARAVDAMRREPDERVRAFVGPCIHACCYEFGAADLATMTNRFGASVAATSSAGAPALDMRRAIRVALDEVGVEADCSALCTGCLGSRFFSHRVRRERQRQVMAVWRT